MPQISQDNAPYKTKALPLSPRSINSDKSNNDPQEQNSSVDQYDEYYINNISHGRCLCDRSSLPGNSQGSGFGERGDYRTQSGNPSGISQYEILTTVNNLNFSSTTS